MTTILSVVLFGFGLVLGLIVFHCSIRIARRMDSQDGRMDAMEEAMGELQDALARKRHTNSTDAGILDVMAELTRIDVNLAEMEARVATSRLLAEAARKRAGIVRQGPYAYDQNMKSEDV